jgi:hypothetical protein
MFDLNRTYYSDAKERPVAAGATISEEGQLLVYVDGGAGEAAVQPCSTGAGQAIAGFAITDALKRLTDTVVETVTVPAGGGTVNLSNANLVAQGAERVVASGSGVLVYDSTPDGGDYNINTTNGTLTFHSAEAGQTVEVTYRYTLTLQESLERFHERSVNNRAQDYFSTVSVMANEGEIFTSMYDTSVAYTVGASIYPAAAGKVSSAAGGASNAIGFVTKVPAAGDALLGVKFLLPLKS